VAKKISLSDAEKEITKFFGEDTVFFDGNISTKYEAIKTGSPKLDEAIGIGGIPMGRITQLAGQESSGKTMLALSCIREYLNQNPENTALFIDAEYTYDPAWAEKQGVDTSRVMVIKTNDAKAIFEGLIGTVKVNSKTKKVSKNMKGILDHVIEGTDPRFKNLGIIVLDSIAVLNTPLELAAEVGKANMAPIPRFMSTELKKLTPIVAQANVAFIGINQVRVNLGQMFGDPSTSPGGKALKHACSLMLNMAPVFAAGSVIEDDSGERVGHTVRAKIQKNKVGAPFKQAEYKIEYQKGVVETHEEVFSLAIDYGLIVRPNNQMYEIGDESIRGKDAAMKYFLENNLEEEFLTRIRDIYINGATNDALESCDHDEEVLQENSLMGMIE
jgi:recombination protein RecA